MKKKQEPRSRWVNVVVTPTEKRKWQAAADERDLHLSQFVRHCVNGYIEAANVTELPEEIIKGKLQ